MIGTRLVVTAVFLISLCGCGIYPRVKDDRIDVSEDFSYPDLVEGGVAVFGVTSVYADPSWHGNAEADMTRRLEWHLRNTRQDLPVTTTDEVKKGLGPKGYGNVLSGYAETGQLEPAVIGALRKLIPTPRYLAFARVDRFVRESGTNLAMAVTIDVFNLETGEVVWKGNLRTGRDVSDTSHIASDSDFEIQFGDESEYFWQLLDVVFVKFAQGLPQP